MDEFNEDFDSKIAIKRPLWTVIATFGAAFTLAVLAVLLRDLVFGLISISLFSVATVLARTCAFSIEKEGIRLPKLRRSLMTPFWGFPNDNLYRWDEVSYGHWSHHQPGELNVQIKRTRSPDNAAEESPSRIFYSVPKQSRAGVEKAFRAHGKWAE